jgi:hypothetical protein
MNKIGFTFSGILVITGIITLVQTTIINLVMPKIGRAAFQCAMAGSYSPNDYHINFLGVNIAAVCLVVIGIIFGYKCYKREKEK